MPIYEQALSPQKILREQSTGLLGVGQPAQLPAYQSLDALVGATSVGNVDFQPAAVAERESGLQQQQQLLGSLVDLGGLAGSLGLDYLERKAPSSSLLGSSNLGSPDQSMFGFQQQGAGALNPILGYQGFGGGGGFDGFGFGGNY